MSYPREDEDAYRLLSPEQEMEDVQPLAVGKPQHKNRLSITDIVTAILCICFFAIAFICVRSANIALELGQKNQLIVVGLLLSLMGLCTSKQVLRLLAAIEASTGKTTLQNLDAILSSSIISSQTSFQYRMALALLLATPLALSVGYKRFQGGTTSKMLSIEDLQFGLTGPPGTQDIGYGLSLFVNATLPWFADPRLHSAYGFNMYVLSENKTAMLDGPLPESVQKLQDLLYTGDSMTVTAKIHAVVADLCNGLSNTPEFLNNSFYDNVDATDSYMAAKQWISTESYWVGLMTKNNTDASTMWIS
ncbi:hypothetical protein L207DRAFT_578542 [Hyaloscypha variabilis F]|uniref:Uncharacterized protein n=1 Tax=Hyaloscypha variabilis (strain UAMH 11265 / GT02V1 / F) TaxID=1149755 RepID=A0A2J6S4D6_HYAVF|nr:hypothetical protein L207DRAFT_578542 [Hyaloscypha variabilis F]